MTWLNGRTLYKADKAGSCLYLLMTRAKFLWQKFFIHCLVLGYCKCRLLTNVLLVYLIIFTFGPAYYNLL